MGKIDEKKKDKEASLFNSSFHLFTTQGFNKTSISNIVESAGVAKGTFYLYFKDKFDIRNKLIGYKAAILFNNAHSALLKTDINTLEDKFIFIIDHIIDQLKKDPLLLRFISKNLSWGIFRSQIQQYKNEENDSIYKAYISIVESSSIKIENPEVTLFTIVELVGSTCYSTILNNDPLPIDEYKPFLYTTIRNIIHQET